MQECGSIASLRHPIVLIQTHRHLPLMQLVQPGAVIIRRCSWKEQIKIGDHGRDRFYVDLNVSFHVIPMVLF